MNYYILDIRSKADDMLLWWRPNNAGYTTKLNDAGIYTHEQVMREPLYYNNKTDTLAVPVDRAMLLAVHVVPAEKENIAMFKKCSRAAFRPTKAHAIAAGSEQA